MGVPISGAIRESVETKESMAGHVPSVDKIWQTFVRKLFQAEQSGSTLLVWCYMTYTSSNVLGNFNQYKSVDGHIFMNIAEGTEN